MAETCRVCARLKAYLVRGYAENKLPTWGDADEDWLNAKHAGDHHVC